MISCCAAGTLLAWDCSAQSGPTQGLTILVLARSQPQQRPDARGRPHQQHRHHRRATRAHVRQAARQDPRDGAIQEADRDRMRAVRGPPLRRLHSRAQRRTEAGDEPEGDHNATAAHTRQRALGAEAHGAGRLALPGSTSTTVTCLNINCASMLIAGMFTNRSRRARRLVPNQVARQHGQSLPRTRRHAPSHHQLPEAARPSTRTAR